MILSLDNYNKVCYKLKHNNKGVEKMFKKKEYTAYIIECIVNNEFCGIVGLFKNEQQAKDCCEFWNDNGMPNARYEIHYILTDF